VLNFNSTNAPQFAAMIASVLLSTATAASSFDIGPCAGFTATDHNRFQGTRTVEQAARAGAARARRTGRSDGHFSDENGVILW
jgi:hypothetical protein